MVLVNSNSLGGPTALPGGFQAGAHPAHPGQLQAGAEAVLGPCAQHKNPALPVLGLLGLPGAQEAALPPFHSQSNPTQPPTHITEISSNILYSF